MGFTALDIVTLLLVGGGLLLGLWRGLVTELLSLATWVAAVAALKLLHDPLADLLTGRVGTRPAAAVLAFVLIFGIVFLGGKILARQVGGAAKGSVIGPVDRLLGGGFGALKGIIFATLLYLAANLLYDTGYGRTAERPQWMSQSRTYPLLHASGRAIVDFVEARRNRRVVDDRDGNAAEADSNAQ